MASGVPAVNLLPCRIRFATDKYLRPGLPRLRLRLRRKRPYHQCDLPRSLQLRNKRCFRTGQVTFVYRQLSVSSNVFSCNLILLAGTQTLGVFGYLQLVDDLLNIAVHHRREVVKRQVDAVVGHTAPAGSCRCGSWPSGRPSRPSSCASRRSRRGISSIRG